MNCALFGALRFGAGGWRGGGVVVLVDMAQTLKVSFHSKQNQIQLTAMAETG